MKNGFRVIDSDGHTMPPVTLWQDLIDPAYRDRIAVEGGRLLVDGKRTSTVTPEVLTALRFTEEDRLQRFGEMAERNFDPPSVVEGMDREGVDLSVTYDDLYATWVDGIDPALAAAMCRAYYRWISDFSEQSGGRVVGAAPLPIFDVDLAIAAIDDAWELGLRAFWVRPNPINGRLLGDAAYDPLYAALVERNAPLSLHEGMGTTLPSLGADRFSSFLTVHACCHPMEQQMAMLSLIASGTFDRFPTLRVAFMESGCSWLPYWLYRLDEHVELVGWHDAPDLKALPSEYFKRQCFISVESDEALVGDVVNAVGDDNILFSTDFPHPDSAYPHAVDTFLGLPGLTDESRGKILFDNALRYYALDASTLKTAA